MVLVTARTAGRWPSFAYARTSRRKWTLHRWHGVSRILLIAALSKNWASPHPARLQERLHMFVDHFPKSRHLALGHAGHAHGFDQIVDRTRGDTLDVRFQDHRCQCLLSAPARFDEVAEIAPGMQLGSLQSDCSPARVPEARSRYPLQLLARSPVRSP